jgi:anti-sigma factor RsiW
MAPSILRPRIPPMWKGGLRRGRERDTMTAYLAEHPELANRLLEILQEAHARGFEPISMEGVKQPFDYERR